MRKERGIFRRKTESGRRNFQILAIAASAASFFPVSGGKQFRRSGGFTPHGLYPQQRVSGSAVPAACRRRRDWLPMGRPGIAAARRRGQEGRLVLQEYTIDRSRAFRSTMQTPCTVWPRTVMRGALRKENSGHNSVPKPARRTEPSPRNPRFAARPKGVAVQRKVWGSQEGAREPYGALAPFCPRRGHGLPRRRTAAILPRRGYGLPLTDTAFSAILEIQSTAPPFRFLAAPERK